MRRNEPAINARGFPGHAIEVTFFVSNVRIRGEKWAGKSVVDRSFQQDSGGDADAYWIKRALSMESRNSKGVLALACKTHAGGKTPSCGLSKYLALPQAAKGATLSEGDLLTASSKLNRRPG